MLSDNWYWAKSDDNYYLFHRDCYKNIMSMHAIVWKVSKLWLAAVACDCSKPWNADGIKYSSLEEAQQDIEQLFEI